MMRRCNFSCLSGSPFRRSKKVFVASTLTYQEVLFVIPSDLRHSQRLLGNNFNVGVNGPYVRNAAAVNDSRAESLACLRDSVGLPWLGNRRSLSRTRSPGCSRCESSRCLSVVPCLIEKEDENFCSATNMLLAFVCFVLFLLTLSPARPKCANFGPTAREAPSEGSLLFTFS